MESVDLMDVLLFLDMNKDLIYIPEDKRGIHNIDSSKIDLLIDNIKTKSCLNEIDKENSIKFIRRLFEVYKYVPFNDYIDLIKKVSINIMNFLNENHDKYSDIYFCANGEIIKSNTWVLLLFLNEMKDFLNEKEELKNKIKIISVIPNNTSLYSSNTLFLYFDDMSYSGTQISLSIPRNKKIQKTTNTDIYITTPIISDTAIGKIHERNKHVKYWDGTIVIGNLYDLFVNDNEEYKKLYDIFCNSSEFINILGNKDKLIRGFQCYAAIIPIYFDHKIADSYSTFQKLLNFGTYPIVKTSTCEPECITTPLINNCDNFMKNEIIAPDDELFIQDTNIKKNLCHEIIMDIEAKNTCPNTFYKTFQYHLPCKSAITDDEYKNSSLVSFIQMCNELKKYNSLKIHAKYRYKYIEIKNLLFK
jgi:hypothetical protein